MKNEPMMHISITPSTVVKAVMVLLGFYLLYFFSDLVMALLASVVLASAIEPATIKLVNYKFPRVLSVIIIYILIFFILFGVIFLFLPVLLQEVSGFVNIIPKAIKALDILGYLPDIQVNYFDSIKEAVIDAIAQSNFLPGIRDMAIGGSIGFLEMTQIILGSALNFSLIIVFSFYLAVQEDGVANFLKLITHVKQEKYVLDLWQRSRQKIGYWMQGQVFLGLLMGVFVFLGLTILGIKYALILALVAAVFELIPVFGPILAAVPAVLIGFAQGPVMGLMILGFYIIIQQFESHLIYPLIVRKIIGVPPLLVILSLIIGARLSGFLGVLLAVPIAAVFMELVNDLEKSKRFFAEHGTEESD